MYGALYAFCAVIMMATSPLLAAERDSAAATRVRFTARHRCAIVERLDLIHRRGPVEESRNRFIVIALRDQPQRYVQCIFEDRDTRMFCEASSGAYGPTGPERLQLNPSELAALRTLGFIQDNPNENFARSIELGDPPDVGIAADLMLVALHDAYGARAGSAIDITAPNGRDPVGSCGTPES